MVKDMHYVKGSRVGDRIRSNNPTGRRKREKIFTEQIPTKFSKELLTAIDYVVANYHFNGKRVYRGRSNFIRSACIYMLRLKLTEMGENDKLKKF